MEKKRENPDLSRGLVLFDLQDSILVGDALYFHTDMRTHTAVTHKSQSSASVFVHVCSFTVCFLVFGLLFCTYLVLFTFLVRPARFCLLPVYHALPLSLVPLLTHQVCLIVPCLPVSGYPVESCVFKPLVLFSCLSVVVRIHAVSLHCSGLSFLCCK